MIDNKMFKNFLNQIKLWLPTLYGLVGAFVIAAGWNWYHTAYRPHSRFILVSLLTWVAVYAGYRVFKWLYHFFAAKFNRNIFWQKEFGKFLDSLFFIMSLFFLVFFSRQQLLSIGIFLAVMIILYHRTQFYLSAHPNAKEWKIVNKNVFTLIFFLFSLFSVFQYLAYRFANFDSYLKFYNIVLFRSWAMTMFLILGFAASALIFWKLKSPWRYLALSLWAVLFVGLLFLWSINVGIMYFSGLYISPLMFGLVRGSSGVVLNWLTGLIVAGGLVSLALFGFIFHRIIRSFHSGSFRQWAYYSLALIAVALVSLFGLSSFKNTPEYTIARSFYNFFRGQDKKIELSPVVKEKLEKFGLYYNTENFNLAHKDKIFNSDKNLLPAKFTKSKPNVIIIFLESFSSRLTSVYNPDLAGLTPGFEQMAADPRTTIFKNYFNGSTPTITGIISQLCSLFPPTGYTEIEVNKNLQNLHLLCLPKILKDSGGYKSTSYITAVDKKFENKDSIFSGMGTDNVYGTDELKNIINGEPLSWGYSDHQLFPAMWQLAQKEPEPFLMMLSTVDTHPPFDLAKDMVRYKDGKNNVLNSFHTTDDAFVQFWEQFKQSKYYDNTIVVVVADHAAFPGADIKKLFPADAASLSFYDQNMFMMYVPGGNLPKEINTYSSGIDVAPTLLQVLDINTPNSFEGHSIFDDRNKYPNLLGMHEFGLYINQVDGKNRKINYEIPTHIACDKDDYSASSSSPLTLCEYLDFYRWKRQMFEQGRFWEDLGEK